MMSLSKVEYKRELVTTLSQGAVITRNGEFVCHKMWEQHKCIKSSAWRELSAIEYALESLAHASVEMLSREMVY